MVIFIAGASGYLGSQLAKRLSCNHRVVALLRSTSDRRRIRDLDLEEVHLDNEEDLLEAFESKAPQIVINTITSYGRSGESESDLVLANISLPSKLLSMAETAGSTAFIHAGTCLPSGLSLYADTKNSFVELVKSNFDQLDSSISVPARCQFINLELEHFYGPGDDPGKFITKVVRSCLKGETIPLTDGTQRRDFIYIDDVLSAYEILIEKVNDFECYESFSLGSGQAYPVRRVVELIHTLCASKAKLDFGAIFLRPGEPLCSCADLTKLNSLGWTCDHALEDGIRITIERERE